MNRLATLLTVPTVVTLVATSPVETYAYDTASHGYGQGTIVNSDNVPIGATTFDETYGVYGAHALTTDSNRIVLTFDQGYENGYTAQILDTLKEKGVKAIFFLTGDYAKSEHALVQRMVDEGHCIGNHGMSHAQLPTLDDASLRDEVMSLHQYVLEEYGYEMQYLRPPCGEYSESSLATTQALGYQTVLWSFAYVDWNVDAQPDPSSSLQRLVDSAHGGAIYLLHSVSQTNAEILGDAIDALRAQGYTL